ncbi:hypothetical protein RJ639_020472 [Escallonia herrerae]|uniref:Retrotransposon Copia-like N-terminal domain-containing protein n=1 Tax=Escallonia herrerae TaxID=1293975 RepID=A0AA88V688_9ASTE|nr:hypothetical protein RJ639_020472 [Escallonia herrerae]
MSSAEKDSSSSTMSEAFMQPATPQSFGDNSSLQITSHKLKGKNFLPWSRSILLVIRGRGKMGLYHWRDATSSSRRFDICQLGTQQLNCHGWLINSMESHISQTYLFLRTAKAIWDAVHKNYFDLGNASQVFETKNKLKEMHQGKLGVTKYYNELQTLWQELDMHYEADWGDLEGNLKFKRHLEKERLYEFLTGLNRELDEVRGRILGRRPLPSIDEAFAEVRREASRRRVMLGGKKEVTSGEMPMETVALATKNNPSIDKSSGDQRNGHRGGRPWCSHCNKPGHTRDTCRDIHGKPSNWKSRGSNKGKGFQATVDEKNEDTRASSETNGVYFTKAQLEQLQKFLSQPTVGSQNIANSHYAQGTALHAQNKCPWILDSGASDHMTGAGIGEDDWQC